ncbi:MAG: hypothetical protein JNJ88_14765 [Planctomycetes bacterium]|nr:hypothetical protein [Planctomycetota bacterium]
MRAARCAAAEAHKSSISADRADSSGLAGRNPTLFQSFEAWFLLRAAERAFLAGLLKEPPRITRFSGAGARAS